VFGCFGLDSKPKQKHNCNNPLIPQNQVEHHPLYRPARFPPGTAPLTEQRLIQQQEAQPTIPPLTSTSEELTSTALLKL